MLNGGGLLDSTAAANLFQFSPLFMAAAGMNQSLAGGQQTQQAMPQLTPQQIQHLMQQQQYLMFQQVGSDGFEISLSGDFGKADIWFVGIFILTL